MSVRPPPKPIRLTDPDYLDFVRAQICTVCPTQSDPHHMVTVGAGGSDYATVPLCIPHHTEWHQGGAAKFAETHNVELWRAVSFLLIKWIQHKETDHG